MKDFTFFKTSVHDVRGRRSFNSLCRAAINDRRVRQGDVAEANDLLRQNLLTARQVTEGRLRPIIAATGVGAAVLLCVSAVNV